METQHTPGPWTSNYSPSTEFGCGYGKSQIINAKGIPFAAVAAIAPESEPEYEGGSLSAATLDLIEANARLIAAAPDLLAACYAAESYIAFGTSGISDVNHQGQLSKRLSAAIAKATEKV